MVRPVLIALTVCAALAPAAHGNVWTDWQAQRAIAVADAHWASSPCYGRQQITWITGREIDQLEPGHFTSFAILGSCRTVVAWDRVPPTPAWLCTTLEHEFGHLAGLGHSNDPRDVMYWLTRDTSPDCRAAFRPRRWRVWGR